MSVRKDAPLRDKTMHLVVGRALHSRIRRYAVHYYMSQAEFIRLAIVHYLDNHVDPSGAESAVIHHS